WRQSRLPRLPRQGLVREETTKRKRKSKSKLLPPDQCSSSYPSASSMFPFMETTASLLAPRSPRGGPVIRRQRASSAFLKKTATIGPTSTAARPCLTCSALHGL